ncbi:MAG: diguanylate cyclase [Treponema sp.]|jgi:diguanylate cyclase (GGDEF)-like protein|nr:diguanylate cyclase [Treponema sp.]
MSKHLKKERKINGSVGRRLTALIIFMIAAISSVMMLIGFLRFKESAEDYYWRLGETTAGIIALTIDADSVAGYFETLTMDDEYERIMEILQKAKEECEAQTLYVFIMAEKGIYYIFDTDTSNMAAELGDFDPFLYTDKDTGKILRLYPEATEKQLRDGGEVDTIMGITQYGWTITVNEPLYGGDGSCKAYVGIDFDVNQVIAGRRTYLWQFAVIILIVTAAFAVIYLYIIRKAIIIPINIMAKAADRFLVNKTESGNAIGAAGILSMEINTGDELQSLAESLKSMVRKIDEYLINLSIATKRSETDVLTSLCNRGAFEQQVTAILRLRPEEGKINAFMMIDVDYFKAVNDNHGHAAGDEALTKCAQALRSIMRESDVVGRLGGDEFAVFCKDIGSASMAENKARQIRDEWLKVIPPGGGKGITASIGISFAPQDGKGYQELYNKADEALYRAKEAGRDRFAIAGVPLT